jgi:hypothetical protein
MRRIAVVSLVAAMCSSLLLGVTGVAGASTTAAQPKAIRVTRSLGAIPVSGQCTNATTGQVGTFTGTLQLQKFVVQNGALAVQGLLSGSCSVDGSVTNVPVTLPVATPSPVCTILTLNLGPLHLDLLGLVIDLSPVTLVITAVPGPGNLLGNLLCAVAHLLDGGGSLSTVAKLLNAILGLLGG